MEAGDKVVRLDRKRSDRVLDAMADFPFLAFIMTDDEVLIVCKDEAAAKAEFERLREMFSEVFDIA